MSSAKLDKLKEKLRRQKKTDLKTFMTVPKKRKKSKSVSVRQLEQRAVEDRNMKAFLREVVNSDSSTVNFPGIKNVLSLYVQEVGPAIREVQPNIDNEEFMNRVGQLWEELGSSEKTHFLLTVFGNSKGAAWGRKGFVDRLTSLDSNTVQDFVTKYIDQDASYTDFYETWVEGSNVVEKLDEGVVIEEAGDKNLREQAISNARAYAKKKGIPTTEKGYYAILDEIIVKKPKSNRQKLHSKISKELIKQASDMGIEGAKNLTLSNLISRITKPVSKKVSIQEKVAQFTKPGDSMKRLVYDEDLVDLSTIISTEKSRLKKLDHTELVIVAKNYGIDVSDKEDNEIVNAIIFSTQWRSQAFLVDSDKAYLSHKLAAFMDVPVSHFRSWTVARLQRKYDDLGGATVIDEEDDDELENTIDDDEEQLRYTILTKNCTETLKRYEWIDARVLKTWIAAVPGEDLEMSYVLEDEETLDADNVIWYRANARFNVLQCTARERVQQGNVLTCISRNGDKLNFMVGYTITGTRGQISKYGKFVGYAKSGSTTYRIFSKTGKKLKWRKPKQSFTALIIQDEEMFNAERRYMKWKTKTRGTMVRDILERPIDSQSIEIATRKLSNILIKIAPERPDYGRATHSDNVAAHLYDPNTVYLGLVMKNLGVNSKETNQTLFTAVANIIFYLELPQAKTYRKRIKAEYYLPEVLPLLSPEDKLPEIFDNPNISEEDQDMMSAFIRSGVTRMVGDMAVGVYRREHPTEQRYGLTSNERFYPTIAGEFANRLSRCQNPEDIENEESENVIFYQEGDNLYCFPLPSLVEQFGQGNYVNSKTGTRFSASFVEKISSMFNLSMAEGGILQPEFADRYGFELEKAQKTAETGVDPDKVMETELEKAMMVMPELWDIIVKDIAEREEEIVSEKSSESGESSSDGDVSDGDEEPKRRGNEELDKQDTCEYCRKHIDMDSGYKSVISHDDKSRIIKFCSINCFENKDDWPKVKGTRKRKRASSKRKKKKQKK